MKKKGKIILVIVGVVILFFVLSLALRFLVTHNAMFQSFVRGLYIVDYTEGRVIHYHRYIHSGPMNNFQQGEKEYLQKMQQHCTKHRGELVTCNSNDGCTGSFCPLSVDFHPCCKPKFLIELNK